MSATLTIILLWPDGRDDGETANFTGTQVPFQIGMASVDLWPTCTRPKFSDGTSMDSEGPCVLCCGDVCECAHVRVCVIVYAFGYAYMCTYTKSLDG